jgi:hypothetical protein
MRLSHNGLQMPKQLKQKTTAEWNATFVRCELDKETKDKVKSWDPKFEATLDAVDQMVTDGYKVSISYDKYHDCVGCFVTHPDPAHKNHGQCLTARGPNYLSALKVLVFKHFQILDGEWGAVVDQNGSRDEWG